MSQKAMKKGVVMALALLTLVLGMPAWTFGGGSHVHFSLSFGRQGGATLLFSFGHPHIFPHPHRRGFFVFGFQQVWVRDHWEWVPGQWVKIPRGVGVWVPGRWIVIDP